MQKIPCLFIRDFSTRPHVLTRGVTQGCEWVLSGEGLPTRKWDGTAVLIRDERIYARHDCKAGRAVPEGFEPCQPDADPVTGHWPGWIEVKNQPQYKWHVEAFAPRKGDLAPGTYELCGPKINTNPEKLDKHILIKHGSGGISELTDRSFDGLHSYFDQNPMEGLVFHHHDGRMCKIRRGDFQLRWPI
jgi:hypothetical protein